jgi:hypothetical protein
MSLKSSTNNISVTEQYCQHFIDRAARAAPDEKATQDKGGTELLLEVPRQYLLNSILRQTAVE